SLVTTSTNPDPVIIKGNKPLKNTYNLGISTSFSKYSYIELGLGYDYSFRPGFKNHSGYGSLSWKF
ncbi:MAG: hypothetical protein V4485_04945, partial [Pseudomonadota bacterium]